MRSELEIEGGGVFAEGCISVLQVESGANGSAVEAVGSSTVAGRDLVTQVTDLAQLPLY